MIKLPMAISDLLPPRTTAGKIDLARKLLAAAEAREATLTRERVTALTDSDNIEAARKLDRELLEQRQATATYRDRIEALQVRLSKEEAAERARLRTEAVDKILAPQMEKIIEAGRECERALMAYVAAYEHTFALRDAMERDWPVVVPRPPFAARVHLLGLAGLGDERERAGRLVSSIKYHAPRIVASITEQVSNYLASIRATKIPVPRNDDENEDIAA
jgi:hypothetical protein